MENSKVYSIFLLMLGISVIAISLVNLQFNVRPNNRIHKANDFLGQVSRETTLEAKKLHIQEAIQVYQEGPNLEGLQNLLGLNSTTQIDYFMSKVSTAIGDEYYSSVVDTPKNWVLGAITLLYVLDMIAGIWGSYHDWSVEFRHIFITIIAVWLTAILVGFL